MYDVKKTLLSRNNRADAHRNTQPLESDTQDLPKLKTDKSQPGEGSRYKVHP